MRVARLLFFCFWLLLWLSGCIGNQSVTTPTIESHHFVEVEHVVGIACDEVLPVLGDRFMPESMAGGCVLFDCDNDGDLDLYRLRYARSADGARECDAGENRLYRQDGPWRFTDITAESNLGDRGYAMGAATGDIDNDGDLDLYIGNLGADRLYRNDGEGHFTDVTFEAGIEVGGWSSSILMVDVDQDGHLDIYVTRYLDYDEKITGADAAGRPEYPPPSQFRGLDDRLLRNDGDGTFTDITDTSGISDHPGRGLGVIAGDFDADGNVDLYVANDGDANHAWLGDGTGNFEESALTLGLAVNIFGQPEASMGLASGDLDGDGLEDIVITHLVHETDTIYRCIEPGQFSDVTTALGLAVPTVDFTGFGTALLDVDQDGDLDLVSVHGRVLRSPVHSAADEKDYWNPYAEEDHLYLNDGAGHFQQQTGGLSLRSGRVEVSRGLAVGDLDQDGDQDLVIANADGTIRLMRNQGVTGHWLSIKAIDAALNRCAIGAVVELEAGGKTQRRRVGAGGSYLSGGEERVHFGLGDVKSIERLRISWPGGEVEQFQAPDVNQAVVLRKGEGI